MSIQDMRDNSEGIVAKIIVGLIIVVFAAFGMGSITTFLAPVAKVATVNGSDITEQEMQTGISRRRRVLQTQDQAIDEDLLRREVLENLINRRLLTQAAEEFGMQFSNASLDAEIVATDVFQVDGRYDREQFQMIIGGAGYTALGYREEMRRDKMFSQISNGIRSTAFVTKNEVIRTSGLAQQTRDIAFMRLILDDQSQKIEITNAEIATYYDENKLDFMTEEALDLAYVELKRDDLLADIDVVEEELILFFEDTRASYEKPEQRRIAHILIETNDEMSEQDAKLKADEVYQSIQSGGDFAVLAKQFSDDPGSAELGGDLGFNDAGTFVPEFEAAAKLLSLGDFSGPVKTEFGYHILKLTGFEQATTPTLEAFRDKVEHEYRVAAAEEIFVDLSARLSELAYESPDLEGFADELSLEVKFTGLSKRSEAVGIAANPAVLEAAYSGDVLLDGNNSLLLEITPNHHVVVHVKAHEIERLKDFEQVTDEIQDIIRGDKGSIQLRAEAEEIVSLLKGGSLTRYVADKYGLKWTVVGAAARNQASMDREINQQAFALARPAEGEKSVGFSLLGNGDAVVLSVTNVKNKPRDEVVDDDNQNLGKVLAAQQGVIDYREFIGNLTLSGSVE
ncbi:MAG: SurA N-terminal domain-containing protein [Pseudomonadales bacterium]|nr:SurA N-terminal domain-containing protein [Pseudomonadales bacterium]